MPVTLPLSYALTVYSGTTFRKEFVWKPDGAAPQDFTGWAGVMRIGAPGQTAMSQLSSTGGGVTLSSTGQIVLAMTPAQTSLLPDGTYAYTLDLIDPDGAITRFLRGRIEFQTDVKALP